MRILIVADDVALATGLSRILQAEGYVVELALRGDEALAAAKSKRVDLMILNFGLPAVNASKILRMLRAAGHHLPVLVLAARDAVTDRVRALDLGADAYLTKPFAMPELLASVRALIRRSQARSSPRIVYGLLTVDTVARRAYLADKPLQLSPREWAVLEVLLGRVGQVASKESIIQAVAGLHSKLTPSAIEICVSRLRAKLEPAGIEIRTVRGFGYVLEEEVKAK
jgi:two-component system, OmpR family, response regulator